MKRENQVFAGKLKKKELFLIIYALIHLKEKREIDKKRIDKLISKLYSDFKDS